jgi:predicted SAM-dependent methyltransferase
MKLLRRTAILLLPRSLRDTLRGQERVITTNLRWRLKRVFGRRPYPINSDGQVRLHLGCGPVDQKGFINIDAIGFSHVHHLSPVHPLPMFRDESVDLIYVSHCLEHLDIEEVSRALKEWARVLKPGGMLRIAVPDLESILRVYEAAGRRISAIQYVLMGGQDYPFNFHKAVFDQAHLTHLMTDAGFSDMTVWKPGQDQWCAIKDCSSAACVVGSTIIPVSLNLQGSKTPK